MQVRYFIFIIIYIAGLWLKSQPSRYKTIVCFHLHEVAVDVSSLEMTKAELDGTVGSLMWWVDGVGPAHSRG